MRLNPFALPFFLFALVPLAACGGGGTGSGGGGGGAGGSGAGGGGTGPLCTMPTTVTCSDQIILQMNLQPDVAPGMITNMADGAGWQSKIDATAGGAFATKPDSYVYAKFTDQGLEKVMIADQDSLDSMDWDIAFRRYVIRINSADSGPSCVQAARVPPATTKYEDVTAVPDNLGYKQDDYFTDSCDLIPDGTGLPDSPATALSSYWSYPGCVAMTHGVFVIELADGKHVKFTVDDYYAPAIQDQCDSTGMIPMSNTGSANFVARWQFLQ
jgi:hypothetical protein